MFKFIRIRDKNNNYDLSDVQITSDVEMIDDVLEVFEDFLKACGYIINNDDHLKIVKEDET